jgi:hypothetical protein
MVKPTLIPTIPPVTLGGRPHPVVSNLFDSSGSFRQRGHSFKRARRDDEGDAARERVFDISRDAVPLVLPAALKLDLDGIRALMVKANDVATPIRAGLVSDPAAADLLGLASSSIALLDLVNAVVEKALLPLASLITATQQSAASGSEPTAPSSSGARAEAGWPSLRRPWLPRKKPR